MSNSAVTVLLQNARRVKVQVTPDTSLLQILEDVCKKQELNANEWDLKHYNRIVELGKSIRFSGLPNNTTLELVPAAKPRKETAVNLGLQLESGKRLTHQFSPQTTLWSVLEHWEKEGEAVFPPKEDSSKPLLPVIVYMRQDIVGKENLEEKTLKNLGLFQGSALVRLVHREENQVKHQANVSSILTPKTPATPSISSTNHIIQEPKNEPKVDEENRISSNNQSEDNNKALIKPSTDEPAKNDINNVINSVPPVSNNEPSEVPMEVEIPNAIPLILERQQQLRCQAGELNVLGEYNALLYHSDDVSPRQVLSQPDTFYEVTISDVRSIYHDRQTERKQLEEAPLQTESLRLMEQENTMQKHLITYPTTIVRIRFPDRFVLQGTFKTDNSIKLVSDFVRGFLDNPNLDFHLFKTPPKEILSQEKTLLESGLFGFAVIYIGSIDKPEKYLKDSLLLSDPEEVFKVTPEGLSPTYHHSNKTRKIENSSETKHTTINKPQEISSASSSSQSSASTTTPQSSSNNSSVPSRPSTTATDGVVPKWFKGIGKKT